MGFLPSMQLNIALKPDPKEAEMAKHGAKQAFFKLERGEELLLADTSCDPCGTDEEQIAHEMRLQAEIFDHFLRTKEILPFKQRAGSPYDEEQYLGACMGVCHNLNARAIKLSHLDDLPVKEIKFIVNVANILYRELVAFDLRNGHLRKNFDTVKYAVQSLDTLLYNLSFVADVGDINDCADVKVDFSAVKDVLEKFDLAREDVIKKSRDIIKPAKNAISAALRGDTKESDKLLHKATEHVKELLSTTITNPLLRTVSFSSALEEMQEAILVVHWVKHIADETMEPLPRLEFCTDVEYLGGLMDFCGELNRWAVREATKREQENVSKALRCVTEIHGLALSVNLGGLERKLRLVSDTVRKLEKQVQDLKFAKMLGREGARVHALDNTDD